MSIKPNKDLRYKAPRHRKTRPKTFKTEEAAHKWAKESKIEAYNLVNLKSETNSQKKIKIVVK